MSNTQFRQNPGYPGAQPAPKFPKTKTRHWSNRAPYHNNPVKKGKD